MEKKVVELKSGDVATTANIVSANWDAIQRDLHIGIRSIYNLIAVKKKFIEASQNFQEAIITLAVQHGGILQDDGTYKIPQENIDEVNKLMDELYKAPVEIEYTPIVIGETDSMPPQIIDWFFDFIEFNE